MLGTIFRLVGIGAIIFIISGCGGDDKKDPGTPANFSAVNGLIYKGLMGSNVLDNPIVLRITDSENNPVSGQTVTFSLVVGDGTLSATSQTTNASGEVTVTYSFSGTLGHGEIIAAVNGLDPVSILVRANTLIPRAGGQGQYVQFDDRLETVFAINGNTVVDVFSGHPLMYANYESTLGVVIVLDDVDMNQTWYDTSSVLGVIVNTVYDGKIADSLGIASPYQALVDFFGVPDTVYLDIDVSQSPPDTAWYIRYGDQGLTFYSSYADTLVKEIHLAETTTGGSSGGTTKQNGQGLVKFKRYGQ